MPKTGDILCPICAEYIGDRDSPLGVLMWAEQPEDRVGTTYDLAKVPPFLAMLSVMRVPRFEACDQCCFVATKAADGTRTGPPIFTVDLTIPALRAYFVQEGASTDVPGLTTRQAASVGTVVPPAPTTQQESAT